MYLSTSGYIYFYLYYKYLQNSKTLPHEWDARLSIVIIGRVDEERAIYLKNIERGIDSEIGQISNLITLLEKRGDYTTEELVEHYVSNSFNGYLFPFMKYLIKKLNTENRIKTASTYETARRSFSRFRYGEDILIDKIDATLMLRYETYLKSNGVILNSISCNMRALRAAYNHAVQKGLAVSKNPFKEVYTGIDKTSKRAVNEDVVVRLSQLDLSEQGGLQLARDLFMFSFYTRGMSFVDMANLKQNNLKNGYLVYSRSKTKQALNIKVEKCINEIIERHKDFTIDNYLLPIYNTENRDYNSHLRTYNKRLKRLSEILGLEKPLSSYVSRHSWATIALRKGISVQVISEGMGHENEKTTRIYLASLDQNIIDDANAQIIAL